jgi:hypothetical protein
MFLSTSGKRADTSLPSVMAMMVFCIASFLDKYQPRVQRAGYGRGIRNLS